MENLRLAKHHGLGNDFLVLLMNGDEKAALERLVDDLPEFARGTCHRRTGVGADGLILGTLPDTERSSLDADGPDSTGATGPIRVQMTLFNSDGSSAAVSGNGMACLVHEVARSKVSGMDADGGAEVLDDHFLVVTVETEDGSRAVSLDAELKATETGSLRLADPFAEVHMPNVVPGPAIAAELDKQINEAFGSKQRGTGDVGNPHLVINSGRPVDAEETCRLGAAFEAHYPSGINVEFIWRSGHGDSGSADPSSLGMSVWERGAGLTQACGTGAVTAAVLARDWGLVEPNSDTIVEMPGGEATISTDGDDDHPVLCIPVEHLGDYEWPLHATSLDA